MAGRRGGSVFVSAVAGSAESAPAASATAIPAASSGWVAVDYSDLIDRRRPSHSGEPVGVLLRDLAGRTNPTAGDRPPDATRHILLDPLLEPYAFVMQDAVDSLAPVSERTRFEVGALYRPGGKEPAWAELLRARSFLVESDGGGGLRLFLPWVPSAGGAAPAVPPRVEGATAAREAFDAGWPVLRHVFAAERRRLGLADGSGPDAHPLAIEARAFVHEPARTRFHLGLDAYRTRVDDTRPRGSRPPLDLGAMRTFLERGLQLEGGRLEPDGTLRLLGTPAPTPPQLLGRPTELSDFAVAYRAVFHGGLAEPYMSLDRGRSPHMAVVNYGGRLRDTSLGLVSLLCDVRFKTFSLGIDAVADEDVRERLRKSVPMFRSHLERLAADARSKGIAGQQTRLWFYPDEVDLTLSQQGDLLAMRRVRMTASSERVLDRSDGKRAEDPPWTLETVVAINRDYEALARFFPELADLDQVARLLSLFTWLRQARAEGLPVPDLDVLLALDLRAEPTPREFPQLLAFNALPPPSGSGPVQVWSRLPIVDAVERMLAADGRPIPARRRFDRALRALDRRLTDQAALAREMESTDLTAADDAVLDVLSFRAERLRMHQLVLSTLPSSTRDELSRREPGLRVFSVGIGGLDLGMSKSLARAKGRSEGIADRAAGATRGERAGSTSVAGEPPASRADPDGLPATSLPPHGGSIPAATAPRGGLLEPAVSTGSGTWGDRDVAWTLTVYGSEGRDVTSRRLVFDRNRRVQFLERVEDQRQLRFRFEREGTEIRARIVESGLKAPDAPEEAVPAIPSGLAILDVKPGFRGKDSETRDEPASVSLRLRAADGRDLGAPIPRAVAQRLVAGREADLTTAQPLPGLSPSDRFLGGLRHLMVMMLHEQNTAPWEGSRPVLPGEEDPVRIASALASWWRVEPAPPGVVVGTDGSASPARWERAPRPRGEALLLLPKDAFPGHAARLRDEIAGAWPAGNVSEEAPRDNAPPLVIVASAEAPAAFGTRLRALASDPSLRGRLLGAYSLAGPVRSDLPASLIRDGGLAGLGVAEGSPAGVTRMISELRRLGQAVVELRSSAGGDRRIEDLPGPFLWYF